jgi:C4-dicarboxylate-specific signal transduction histidine kinase
MEISPALRRLLPLAGAILLSVAVALGIIEITRLSLEQNYKEALATEVTRRGFEVMAKTMNGNVMGAVAALGLVDQTIKSVARGEIPLDTPVVMESLRAIGQSYAANGAYIVNLDGIIKSSWDTVGVPLTGVDVKFRPYFQIAMRTCFPSSTVNWSDNGCISSFQLTAGGGEVSGRYHQTSS